MKIVRSIITKAFTQSALLLILFSGSAHAVDIAAGVDISTLGPGASITIGIRENINFRAGYNAASIDDDITEDGVTYDVDLDLAGTSLLVDWHAFGGTFRFTGGLIANGTDVTGRAQLTGPVDIGGTTFTPAQVGTLNASLDFDSTAPYFGVGWGNAVATKRGFSFAADLGFMFTGDPDFELTQQGGTLAIPQSNLDAEEQSVEDDLDDFDLYPIARVGFAYFF